jgi:hypothetical protein
MLMEVNMSKRYDVLFKSNFRNGFPLVSKSGKPCDWQNGDRIPVNDLKEYLDITPPEGEDFQRCSIHVETQADVIVECSVKKRNWKIRFLHSDDTGADSPTTINVTIAPPEGNGP